MKRLLLFRAAVVPLIFVCLPTLATAAEENQELANPGKTMAFEFSMGTEGYPLLRRGRRAATDDRSEFFHRSESAADVEPHLGYVY